jgi:hypothetical protein
MRVIVSLVVAALAVSSCAKKDEPDVPQEVDPVYRLTAEALQRYRVVCTQDVAIDMDGQPMSARRTYKATFTLTDEGQAANGYRATITLDALDVELVTSDGPHTFDTGHIVGKHLDTALDRKGGALSYAELDSLPPLDTAAMVGVDADVAFLFDYVFPRLPDGPVGVGNTWRVNSTRTQIEGIIPVTTQVATTHQLAGFQTVDGFRCMKIESRSTAVLEGAIEDMEPPWQYKGSLRGTGIWYFAIEEGFLVLLALEEISQGNASMGGMSAPTQQNTTIEVQRVLE